MTEIKNKDRILEAIDQLRRRKARPDIDRICNFVFRRFGVDCKDTLADLQRLVETEVVIKVEYKGNTSYRNAAKWSKYAMYKNRELRNSTGSTEIHNILSRAFASLLVEDPDYLDIGVPRTELERFMLQDDPLTDLTEIELILTKETSSGFLVKLKNGNYSLADHPVPPCSPKSASPVSSSPVTVQAKGSQQSVTVNAAEKPPKPKTSSPHKEKKPKLEPASPPAAITISTVTTSSPAAAATTASMSKTPTKSAPKTPPKAAPASPHASGSKADELGAVNIGGYRVGVRRKTAKKVFDPSDNYTPTRKRGRPAGSVGRREASAGGVCCLCNGARKPGSGERLLQCRDCSNRAHPNCIAGKHSAKERPLLNQWVCHGCKLCAFCFETGENEAMAVCVECGDAYHLTCHNPPVTEEQWRSKWLCSSCDDIDKVDIKPVYIKPVDIKPVDIKPLDIKPVDIKPVDIKPVDIKPVDDKPVDDKPVDDKPVDVKAVDVKPVDVKAVDVKAVDAKRVDANRVDAKRVDANRVDAKRVDAKRVDAKRVDAKRVDAKRVDAKRVDAKRVDAKRVDAKRVDAKRVDAKRVDAKRVDAKRVDAKRVDAKRVDTKPIDTKPIDTKPIDTKPIDTKPIDVKPADTPIDVKPADTKPVDIEPVIKAVDLIPADVKPTISKATPVTEVTSTTTPATVKLKRLIEEDPFFKKYVPKEKTPDPTNWTVDEVCKYLQEHGCAAQAEAFRHHEIDGRSLLLLSRRDVLYELGLKLGPALKVNHFVQLLQKKDIRKVFPFNEMLGHIEWKW